MADHQSDISVLQTNHAPSRKVVLLSACYGVLFLLMLVLAYQGTLPVAWLSNVHNADKIGHLVLYCVPSYLGHILFRYKHIAPLRLPVFPGLFTLFTITEELIQGLSPNRTLDAGDMVCSLIGIAVGYRLAQRQYHKLVKAAKG
ncbi:MAG: hypothetical protein AAGL08_19675 [Cyanobacteria bacterium J06573_11]